jgi:paraquat-inducible protein B
VKKQRIETWLAEMKRQELQALAGGNLEADRIKLRKRLEAQHEWGNNLIKIVQLQDTQPKRAVALRLLQALETAASEPSTRKLLTEDTIKMLSSVRDRLK